MLLKCVIVVVLAARGLAFPVQAQKAGDSKVRVRVKREDDISVSSLQILVEEQAQDIERNQAELAASSSRISSLESGMESLQARVDSLSSAVAFSVRLSRDQESGSDGVSLGANRPIIFNQAITNVGNHYSPTTGIFTTPVAGSYAFFLSQMTPNHHHSLALAITKNGEVTLDRVFSEGSEIGDGEEYDQGSSLVTAHLASGDQVWVQLVYGDAVRGSFWTIFSGFLLHAD